MSTIQLVGYKTKNKPRAMTKEERQLIRELIAMEYTYYTQIVNNANRTKKYPKSWDAIHGRLEELQEVLSNV